MQNHDSMRRYGFLRYGSTMRQFPVDSWVGTKIGRFRVLERLAVGGMSVVYRVYDEQRGEQVALKVIHEAYIQNETIVARFQQESDLVLRLKHPNLVEVYETGILESRMYILLQLIDGGSLAQILEVRPTITLAQTTKILSQIGSVLDYIHSRRVIHRDIKLGNVLIDKQGKAYLIDFGIARWLDGHDLTEAGFNMPGTARYMPPEQVAGGTVFDYRADLYSLGVVAYFLSTGYFPFTGVNDLVLMNQHLTMKPSAPSSINPALPDAVDPVLFKALAKRPDYRYSSAAAFMEDYTRALSGHAEMTVALNAFGENPGHLLPVSDPTGQPRAYYPLPAPVPDVPNK
jgi:eukaryotic-like serine/threonine-protein kinase